MSSPNEQLKTAVIGRLLNLETAILQAAAPHRVKITPSPAGIALHLETVPFPVLIHTEENLKNLFRSFELCAAMAVDPWNDREFFLLSMRNLGLIFPPDFLDRVGPGDIVEAYDLDRRQIFRNMRFMELSSYSLLEVLTYEWPVLFERAQRITEEIMKWGEQIMWDENRTVEVDIPEHFIRELRSSQPQVAKIRHKLFAPLYCGPNKPFGVLSVCRGEVVIPSLNPDITNVSFI